MKKVIYSVAIAATFLIVACGPSAEEIAKKEALRNDSIAKVTSDSLAVIEAQKQQMMQDSILAAEEAAAKKKGSAKPKTKPAAPKVDPSKVGDLTKGGGTPTKVNVLKKGGAK